MQQLLVTSQSGVRQVLLPIANMRQALVARGGVNPGTRFIYARHFVGVPARLATPITVRAVGSTSAVQADAPVVTAVTTTAVATSTTGTASASPGPAQEQRVLIQELLANGQVNVLELSPCFSDFKENLNSRTSASLTTQLEHSSGPLPPLWPLLRLRLLRKRLRK